MLREAKIRRQQGGVARGTRGSWSVLQSSPLPQIAFQGVCAYPVSLDAQYSWRMFLVDELGDPAAGVPYLEAV